MSSPAISVNQLSKKYGIADAIRYSPEEKTEHDDKTSRNEQNELWALNNISFDLGKGDTIGIIGRNGSGKSTLLNVLSGITRPTSGQIKIKGAVTSVLEIGAGFHPDLTGKENIFFHGRMIGMSRARINERLRDIIEFSGVENFLNTPIKHYSSGMSLRLAMSVIFHSDADILLLDEVLAVGDAEFRMRTFNKIQSILSSGITVLMVSHSMSEILQMCNKCLVLEQGKMIFNGPTPEAVSNYLRSSIQQADFLPRKGESHIPGSTTWEWSDLGTAPGNDAIRLKRVTIKGAAGRTGNEIYIEDAIEIQVQFWKLKPGFNLQLLLLFLDMMNNQVFYAAVLHNKSQDNVYELYRDETGVFCMKCELPGKFFNHGSFSVQLRFGQDSTTEVYIHKELFHFTICENPEVAYSTLRDMTTPLRPSFHWQHEKITSL